MAEPVCERITVGRLPKPRTGLGMGESGAA